MVGIAAILLIAIVLRVLAAAGVVALPRLTGAALLIGLMLGAWELALVLAALGKVTLRRQLRHHYRTPTETAGIVGDEIVRVFDLTPVGVGLLSSKRIETGSDVDLLVDLPMVDGALRPVRLQLTARTCHRDPQWANGWRIGGTVVAPGDQDREALLEYCHIVAARSRLVESGRLSAVSGERAPLTRAERARRRLETQPIPAHAANS